MEWGNVGRRLVLVALALNSAACGGGGSKDDNTDPGTPGPDTASAFCDTLYTTFAQRYADCSKAPLAWATEFIDKTKLCANLVKAVGSGIATYDKYAAGRCLTTYDNATCSDLRALRDDVKYVADCHDAIKGSATSGGPSPADCYSDYECSSGRCYGYDANCPGTCVYGVQTGILCNSDHACTPGTYCYSGFYLWPKDTCQPYTNRAGENQYCTFGTGCLPGLYCAGAIAGSGTCKPQVSGGTCTGGRGEMAPGYGCFAGTVQALLGPGATCTFSPDYCGPGLYCGAGNVCTQEPLVGEPCVYFNGAYQGCIGGICDTSHQCVVSPYVDPCYSDWDCDSKGYCINGACKNYCVAP